MAEKSPEKNPSMTKIKKDVKNAVCFEFRYVLTKKCINNVKKIVFQTKYKNVCYSTIYNFTHDVLLILPIYLYLYIILKYGIHYYFASILPRDVINAILFCYLRLVR